ncbi:MAG: hypothetical protein LBS85_08510 [Clostridiales Family XIII bacterium]|jgi:hypothetical protein|nr:hypothetical protein [Clostridiales Family XIII bacterium]
MAYFGGKWDMVVDTPLGEQHTYLELKAAGDVLTGVATDSFSGKQGELYNGKILGNEYSYEVDLTIMLGQLHFSIKGRMNSDGTLSGISTNKMGEFDFTAARR